MDIGIRQLRANAAVNLRRAAAGERIVITVNGRPAAQLGPLDETAPDIDRLIAAGAIIPPRRTGPWRAPQPVAVWAGVRIDRALRELRG